MEQILILSPLEAKPVVEELAAPRLITLLTSWLMTMMTGTMTIIFSNSLQRLTSARATAWAFLIGHHFRRRFSLVAALPRLTLW